MTDRDHTTALTRFLGLALIFMTTMAWAQRPARGQGERPSPEKLFEHFDSDGDGFLSAEEVPRHLAELFTLLDSDGDGMLSAAEIAAAPARDDRADRRESRGETLFQRFDEDGDGSILLAELPERMARRLAMADTDEDGALSREELNEFLSGRAARGDRRRRPGFMKPGDTAAFFEQKDLNGDGLLRGEEIPERLAQRLDQVDLNGDGAVSLEEWEMMHETFRRHAVENGAVDALFRLLVGEQTDPARAFALLDQNGDGSLSKDEFPERIQARFESLDVDHNGSIDALEWDEAIADLRERVNERMAPPGRRHSGSAQFFEFLDENGDGFLQPEEIPEIMADRLSARDADGDGLLSSEEFGSGRGHHRRPRGEHGPPDTEAIFARLDADDDGVITADEVPERFREHFMDADADGDGAVTLQELQDARDARGRRGDRAP